MHIYTRFHIFATLKSSLLGGKVKIIVIIILGGKVKIIVIITFGFIWSKKIYNIYKI